MTLTERLARTHNLLVGFSTEPGTPKEWAITYTHLADACKEAIGQLDELAELKKRNLLLEKIAMGKIAEAIRYERSRAEKAESALANATANVPDADDQSELQKVADEQAANQSPPAPTEGQPA